MIAKTFTLDIELTPRDLAEYVAYMDSDQQADGDTEMENVFFVKASFGVVTTFDIEAEERGYLS